MKVFIENEGYQYRKMFEEEGWTNVPTPYEADLICFTGGSDVSPMLYGERKHPMTYNDLRRDEYCSDIYNTYVFDKPMVGICRGGQFLNVMNGGKMFQHVGGHAVSGTHSAIDNRTDKHYQVSSTHHQMMIPSDEAGEIILYSRISNGREFDENVIDTVYESLVDVEALYYGDTENLCFQPHPEFFDKDHECRKLFFDYLNNLVMKG